MYQFLDTLINGMSRYVMSHGINPYLALVIVLAVFFAECITVYLTFMLLVTMVTNIHPFISFVLRKCGVGEKEPDRMSSSLFPEHQP